MQLKNDALNQATFRTLCNLKKTPSAESDLFVWIKKKYQDEEKQQKVFKFLQTEEIVLDDKLNEKHWITQFGFGRNAECLLGFTDSGEAIVEVDPVLTDTGLLLLEHFIEFSLFSQK